MATSITPQKFPPIGLSPDVWGPIFWNTMHIVSMGYSPAPTEQEQAAARNFYESLAYVIPCPVCRAHYNGFLQESPVAVESRDSLIVWVFQIHNRVNARLGKREVTFEEYIARMRAMSSGDVIDGNRKSQQWILPLAFGIALGVGAVYAYKHGVGGR